MQNDSNKDDSDCCGGATSSGVLCDYVTTYKSQLLSIASLCNVLFIQQLENVHGLDKLVVNAVVNVNI